VRQGALFVFEVRRFVKASLTVRAHTDHSWLDTILVVLPHIPPFNLQSSTNTAPLTTPLINMSAHTQQPASSNTDSPTDPTSSKVLGTKRQRIASGDHKPHANVLFEEYLKHRSEFLTFLADKPRRDRALAHQRRLFEDMGRAQRAAFNSLGSLLFDNTDHDIEMKEQDLLDELQLRKDWPAASLRALVEGQATEGVKVDEDGECIIDGGGHPAALRGSSLHDFFKRRGAVAYLYATLPDVTGLCCLLSRYHCSIEPCSHAYDDKYDSAPGSADYPSITYSPTSPGR
jgi:hypothetical protein